MGMNRSCRTLLLGVILAFSVGAEQYALLVGVSVYAANDAAQGRLNLPGPANDIPALRQVLLDRHHFVSKNIHVLMNEAATRAHILSELTEAVSSLRSGDLLLFYFGGHGTSPFDKHNVALRAFIGPDSGALVPHDFKLTDDYSVIAASLIIGRRDLRPILERVPAGARALVILDACYSQNSVKGISQHAAGQSRGVVLADLMNSANPASRQTGRVQSYAPAPPDAAENRDEPFPYRNVVALTAASKDEPAAEINEAYSIDGKLPTVDGKPHGAFTNALLSALSGGADLNHDGSTTPREVLDYTRQLMAQVREQINQRSDSPGLFQTPQTPQMLAPAEGHLGDLPLFSAGPGAGSPAPRPASSCQDEIPTARKLRVEVENVQPSTRARIAALPGIEFVDKGADLMLKQSGGTIELFDRSGSLIRTFTVEQTADMVARVRVEPAVQQLLGFHYRCQSFDAALEFRPGGRASFSSIVPFDVEAEIEKPSYLLLLNIDKAGTISLAYPLTLKEMELKHPGAPLRLGRFEARPPYGTEHLKLFAFSGAPPLDLLGCQKLATGRLICPDIEPGSPQFAEFLKFLANPKGQAAETYIRFTTF